MPLRLLFFLMPGIACVPPDPPADGPFSEEAPLDAELTPSATIGTVAAVTFTTPGAGTAVVEVAEAGGVTRTFPAASADGTTHEALLVGLAAGVEYTWRAVATLADGEVLASEPAAWRTAVQPLWLPALTLSQPIEAPESRGHVLTTIVGDAPAVALLDHAARYEWWWQGESGTMACQARLAEDGASVLLLVVDAAQQVDIGAVLRVALTGEILSDTRAELGHHDFVELPDGRVAFLAYDARPWNGQDLVGDAIVLLDLATGAEETLWSTWDDLTPGDTRDYAPHPLGVDWTHANGLARDGATGDWLVSLHGIDTIVRLSADGALRWQLGGDTSDFTLTSGEPFAQQHGPTFTPGGVLLFDNRAPRTGDLYSRAVELRLDESAGTATPVWSYDGGQGLFTAFMGSAERLPDGTTLVGWGSGGRIDEVTADGELIWQVDVAIGSPFGFSHTVPTLGGAIVEAR